jgi:hypothetical protein
MNNTHRIIYLLLGVVVIGFMLRCSQMEPSQSLSDIETPEEAVSNAPTATSQRIYQQTLQAK